MANFSKLTVDNTTYDVKDNIARSTIENNSIYDYTEKECGKWVDNKKIYKQTFKYNNVPINQETVLRWNNSNSGNTVSNIDKIIDYKACIDRYKTSDNTFESNQIIPIVHSNMTAWGCGIFDIKPSGFTIWVGSQLGWFYIDSLYITIYYTKTSS